MSESMLPTHPLAGRTAVVTGASRGIGKAIASALVDAGATTLFVARNATALRDAVRLSGDSAVPCLGDCSTADGVAAIVAAVQTRLGQAPDILVNNAGLFPVAPLHELNVTELEAALALNLVAPFRLLRAFLADWRARGDGHVVTIGSVADRQVFPDNGAYAATKFGARAMHEVLRTEVRGTGIRATLVSPGPTDTPLWDPIDPDTKDGYPARAEMLRPEDVAEAVLFAVTRPPSVNVEELRISRA